MSKKKAEKKQIDYKTWILVGFATVALVIVIGLILNFTQNEKFDSGYFHDTNGKIVLTMTKDKSALENSIYESNITHVVYYYDGNKNIVNARAFYEYKDEEEAKAAYPHLGLGEFADSKKMSGKFVVFQVKKELYTDLTVDKVEESRGLLKEIEALVLDYDDQTINKYPALKFDITEDSDIIEEDE